MTEQSSAITGSCACGLCTFTSTSLPTHMNYCYCITCQQCSGGPFMAWLGLPKDAVSWQGDSITTWRSSPVAVRTFCSKCGSNLGMQYDHYPDRTHIVPTVVKTERADGSKVPLPRSGKHIFVNHKPEWYVIPNDGVARLDAFGKDYEEKFPDVMEKLGLGKTNSTG